MSELGGNPFDKPKEETPDEIRERLGLPIEATDEDVELAEDAETKKDEEWESAGEKNLEDLSRKLKFENHEKDLAFQNKTVKYIQDVFDSAPEVVKELGADDVRMFMEALSGIDTDESWDLRDKIIKEYRVKDSAIRSSLAGLTSERAWGLRKKMYYEDNVSEAVKSLAGIEDSRNPFDQKREDIRELISDNKFMSDKIKVNSLLVSYGGVNTPLSWEWRDRMAEVLASQNYDSELTNSLSLSLIGLYSKQSAEMQKKLLAEIKAAEDKKKISHDHYLASLRSLAISLSGDDSPNAWEIRDKLRHEDEGLQIMLLSIAGLDSIPAEDMRDELFKRLLFHSAKGSIGRSIGSETSPRKANKEHENMLIGLLSSLRGVNSHRADSLRHSLETDGVSKSQIARSMYGGEIMVAARARSKTEI